MINEDTLIADLNLSTRAVNILRFESIYTVKHLLDCTENDLRRMLNMGVITVKEIKAKLNEHNLQLKGDCRYTFTQDTKTQIAQVEDSINVIIGTVSADHPVTLRRLNNILKHVKSLRKTIELH